MIPEDNLQRLLSETRVSIPAASAASLSLAGGLSLAHSMTGATLVNIAGNGGVGDGWKLLSPARLVAAGFATRRPESAECTLGTEGFVFLYCATFRYPDTQAGFVFGRSLEDERGPESLASPFDTGALHRKVAWPDSSIPPREFLARHSLPVPNYRELLALRLDLLFAAPERYLDFRAGLVRPDPIALHPVPPGSPADSRLWTFEVRVADEVVLAAPHLEAVFVPRGLTGNVALAGFLSACGSGIEQVEIVQRPGEGDFEALHRHCLAFLSRRGIVAGV